MTSIVPIIASLDMTISPSLPVVCNVDYDLARRVAGLKASAGIRGGRKREAHFVDELLKSARVGQRGHCG